MIYFIQSGHDGPIKIGKAVNPHSRIKELQTGSAEKLILLATLDVEDEAEGELHKALDGSRVRGEWFDHRELSVNIALALALAGYLPPWACPYAYGATLYGQDPVEVRARRRALLDTARVLTDEQPTQ